MPGVAVVGAGRWGPNLARNLAADPEWDLRWVCDPHAERSERAAREFGGRAASSLDPVLEDCTVESVVVATPAHTHAAIVTECLAAGRHVLVEKPLAGTLRDAAALVSDAQARGLVLLCDHTYRFTPTARTMQRLIADGSLGDLVAFTSVRTNASCGSPSDVDVFWDLAHHDLSLIDAFFDGAVPDVVIADVVASADDGRTVAGTLRLEFPSGVSARIDVDWNASAKCRTIELRGTRGTLRWDDLAVPSLLLTAESSAPVPVAVPRGDEPLRAVVREFLEVLRGEHAPRCGSEVDLRVLAALERAAPLATIEAGRP